MVRRTWRLCLVFCGVGWGGGAVSSRDRLPILPITSGGWGGGGGGGGGLVGFFSHHFCLLVRVPSSTLFPIVFLRD